MAPTSRQPPVLRAVRVFLLVLSGLALISGVSSSLIVSGSVAMDPLLGNDASLALAVLAIGVATTLIGAFIPVIALLLIHDARPFGRTLLGLVGLGAVLTPALPFGIWLVYVAWLHPEVDRFFREGAAT